MCIVQMRICVVRIEVNGAFVLNVCGTPIPVVPKNDMTKDGVAVRQIVVKFYGPLSGGFCFGKILRRGHFTASSQPSIRVRKANIGQSITWVGLDRLLKIRDSSLYLGRSRF